MTISTTEKFHAVFVTTLRNAFSQEHRNNLTEATRQMLTESVKSDAINLELLKAISTIQYNSMQDATKKDLLVSLLKGFPADIYGGELEIEQLSRQSVSDFSFCLKKKSDAVFSKKAWKPQPATSMSSRDTQSIKSSFSEASALAEGLTERGESNVPNIDTTHLNYSIVHKKKVADDFEKRFNQS